MSIHIKYCKRCRKPFDIDTSQDLCPECRRKKNTNELRTRAGINQRVL